MRGRIIRLVYAIGITSSIAFSLIAGTAHAQAPGPEVCKGCHEAYVASYETTKHGQKGNVMGPSCQTCHGDATEHVKAGGGRGVGGIFGFSNASIPSEKKAEV